jgi:pyruvate dehydrogenase E2 component (dihydrolipoamide acetyltransferase)
MATDIVMPNLGFDSQSGQVIEWYKQPGDPVQKGEPIALVEADKSNVDLESIASGVLLEVLVPLSEDIDIGTVIARVGTADELTVVGSSSAPTPTPTPPTPSQTPVSADDNDTRVSPVARRLADANNVDLAVVKGSGARGRIMREDVEAFIAAKSSNGTSKIPMALPKVRKAAREAGIDLSVLGIFGRPITLDDLAAYQQPATPPKPVTASATAPQIDRDGAEVVALSRMRRTIGRRLVQSKQAAPHFYVTGEFDLTEALVRLSDYKAKVNDLLQYLTVQALLEVPDLNATFEDDTLYHYEGVNLAVAVALDAGLMTPVIHRADRYALDGLAEVSRDLVKRTRAGKLLPEEMRGGTFTSSNLGVIPQVEHFTAIINPPQVGILAVGTVKQRPVVMNGGFHARDTVHITLSGDHRVVDGMHLGRFMAAFGAALDQFVR